MRVSELFKEKTVFSFEVFPPKRDLPIETVFETLDALSKLSPDFVSVTCGAGGDGGDTTVQIASTIKHKYGRESVAHLPGLNLSKAEVLKALAALKENGIESILALRGDRSADIEPKGDFCHASELVSFIRENGDFDLIGACYPEGHTECRDLSADIAHLKTKVDAGVSHLISQLFFDNALFFGFLDKAQSAGISVPVEAGIMPVTSRKQLQRMVSMCGASIPQQLQILLDKYGDEPEAMRQAGIDYATEQILRLLEGGVDGVHLYTMNNPYVAKKISSAVMPRLK